MRDYYNDAVQQNPSLTNGGSRSYENVLHDGSNRPALVTNCSSNLFPKFFVRIALNAGHTTIGSDQPQAS